MLQDMDVGRLENEFCNLAADAADTVLCFHEGQVLICRGEDDGLMLPTLSQIDGWRKFAPPRYLFRMQARNFFLWTDSAPVSIGGFSYEPARQLRQQKSKEKHPSVIKWVK